MFRQINEKGKGEKIYITKVNFLTQIIVKLESSKKLNIQEEEKRKTQ